MYNLELIGPGGTLTFGPDSPYTVDQIEGLSPPEADIHLRQIALMDGQRYNGAKTQIRTLRVAFYIDWDVERNRLHIYDCLRIKKNVTVHYKSDLADVRIDGYLQSLKVGHFDMKQVATAVILCPQPYWESYGEIIDDLSQTAPAFRFPFHSTDDEKLVFGITQNLALGAITNDGEEETGLIIQAVFKSDCEDLQVINYDTGDVFSIAYSFMAADELTIDTNKGQKTVTLLRSGNTVNLFNYIDADSVWPVLEPGTTTFVFDITTGVLDNIEFTVRHRNLYEGV